jgi:RHH-type proline utilization regulon transcriptional repressor/proline dehydrogenase/delta 1-pyrroline-5-carboxylate dehydrogenase
VRFSADLTPLVLDNGRPPPLFQAALEHALAAPGTLCWRTTIDVAGAVLAVAVDEVGRALAVGSPRFATEAALLQAWAEHRSAAELADLRSLVEVWRQASPHAGPLPVSTEVAAHGLDNLLQDPPAELQAQTLAVVRRLQPAIAAWQPSWAERLSQLGLDGVARFAVLRVHLLRFVAALPSLDHDTQGTEVVRLLREALRRMASDDERLRHAGSDHEPLPGWLLGGVRLAHGLLGWLPTRWVAGVTRTGVRSMAKIFLAGESIDKAGPALDALVRSQRDATLDQLGEKVVSEAEADHYASHVLALVRGMGTRFAGARNGADLPRAHVSVKVSALTGDYDPDDPDGTWQRVGPRLVALLREAKQLQACIQLDAEHYPVRDLTFEMLRRALAEPDLQGWRDVGMVVQAYLRDAAAHLEAVLALAATRGVTMPIRLVKGAYWDAETTEATAHDHLPPQFLNKPETDAMFQMLVLRVLRAPCAQLCVASHNLRDHAFAHAARALRSPAAPTIEHQCLHMTYEALSTAMASQGWAVRNYVPVGSLLVGMAYLVRRILENSSQVGVLTQARTGGEVEVRAPGVLLLSAETPWQRDDLTTCDEGLPPFRNVAPVRLDRPTHRAAFDAALVARRLLVGWLGHEPAIDALAVRNPSDPNDVLGYWRPAQVAEVAPAVARAAASGWPQWPVGERVACLLRAAEQLRAARHDWAALVCLEAGKARAEALGDVDEAIDFLQFYAREALRLEADGRARPLGVVGVVAPWNFPLAIPAGMAVAALVAGNAVVLKPAEQTPLVARALGRLLHAVGVPADALQVLAGDGAVGAALVAHPTVAAVVFTGSRAVGCRIHQALTATGRRAITEMGGKNAIVVTANADLDEAVAGSLQSAFGHAGQKCSAASRILVDQRVASQFVERFAGAARDLKVGPAMAAGTRVNPLIGQADQARLQAAAARAMSEPGAQVLVDRTHEAGAGWQVGPLVVQTTAEGALQAGTLAQTELFGPAVHIVPFEHPRQAIELAWATDYALTGGIFAQSSDDVDAIGPQLPCGNLYVNRGITGARVAIEPFGGFRMSGTGPKAGGHHYLRAFYRWSVAVAPLDAEAQAALCDVGHPPERHVAPHTGHPPHAGHDAPHAGHSSHASTADGGVLAALALRDQLHAWPADCRAVAKSVLDAAVRTLPGLRAGAELTRAIPGQDGCNRWHRAKGPVLLLAAKRTPEPSTVAHALAALAAGNEVRVVALSAAAATTWAPWGAVRTDAAGLAAALLAPEVASVVLDGSMAQFIDILPLAATQAPEARHLRAVHEATPVDDPLEFLRAHLHCQTWAVYTMRHGAPLTL